MNSILRNLFARISSLHRVHLPAPSNPDNPIVINDEGPQEADLDPMPSFLMSHFDSDDDEEEEIFGDNDDSEDEGPNFDSLNAFGFDEPPSFFNHITPHPMLSMPFAPIPSFTIPHFHVSSNSMMNVNPFRVHTPQPPRPLAPQQQQQRSAPSNNTRPRHHFSHHFNNGGY